MGIALVLISEDVPGGEFNYMSFYHFSQTIFINGFLYTGRYLISLGVCISERISIQTLLRGEFFLST